MHVLCVYCILNNMVWGEERTAASITKTLVRHGLKQSFRIPLPVKQTVLFTGLLI